jgi:tRNA pseudouridine13 synthase
MNRTDQSLAETALAMLSPLPYASASLPGIGGILKAVPEHFVVEEKLPYAASGEGEHVYVTFRRKGWNTVDAAKAIQKKLGLATSDIGWGGRKDKTAVTIQTISLRCGIKHPLPDVEEAFTDLPFELLSINRHRNKIKTGHVAANRFTIILSQLEPGALPRAQAIAGRLKETGIPNFYGPQRFGHRMQNIHRGFSLFLSKKGRKKDAFMVSVVQSVLFNIWLKRRMETGDFRKIIEGDIAKKTDTGGMFTIEDSTVESPRFDAGEIIYTGPMFGFKMKRSAGKAAKLEAKILDRFDLTLEDFRRFRAPGSRREAILLPPDLDICEVEEGLKFSFTLPSGAYATTILREFMRQW